MTKQILPAADIEALAPFEFTHPHNPNAISKLRFLSDEAGMSQMGVDLVMLEPGRETSAYHAHYHEEEALYVLSGQGTARIGDDEYAIGAGDFIGYPLTGLGHNVLNSGNEPLVMLVMGQRLAHDLVDYAKVGKRLYRYVDQSHLVDIAAVEVRKRAIGDTVPNAPSNGPTRRFLLTAAEIAKLEPIHKIHFLNPNAVRDQRLLGDVTGMAHFGVHHVTVAPESRSSEFHHHQHEEEAVYVLSGVGTAQIGDDSYTIRAGDFVGYPCNGLAHTIVNHGTEPLVLLVAGQRLAHDVCDYPNMGKRLYRNTGDANLVAFQDIDMDPLK